MTKRMFYPMFLRAWRASFTERNIRHAFAKPGIWPINKASVMGKLAGPQSELRGVTKTGLSTPTDSRSLRQFKLAYRENPSPTKTRKLISAVESLSTKVDILQYENHGLREAIVLEKKKRKKGTKLNLVGEPSKGVELYSPNKVEQARQYQEQKEAQQIQLQAEIDARKIKRAANALAKRNEKEEKAAARQLQKESRAQSKEEAAATKASSLKSRQVAPRPKRSAKPMSTSTDIGGNIVDITQKLDAVHLPALSSKNMDREPAKKTTRGRQIQPPKRFDD
jgi:hypothetical protein